MDNGYARFTRVQVPRFNMLAGFAQVARDGSYSRQDGAEKTAYGIMLDVRVRIVANSAYVLARALTISLRYSFVRTQGGVAGNEMPVISYPTQQRMLLPLLAMAYGLHFVGRSMRSQYSMYAACAYPTDSAFPSSPASSSSRTAEQKAVERMLPLLHLRSACLKAMITQRVYDGMEVCRKACGGHGFASNAGFTELMTSFLPMCTLEGTREVLGQQAGRTLVKMRGMSLSLAADMRITDSEHAATRGCTAATPQTAGASKSATVSDLIACVLVPSNTTTNADVKAVLPLQQEQMAQFAEVLLLRAIQLTETAQGAITAAACSTPIASMSKRKGELAALMAAGTELVAASEAYAEYLVAQAFCEALQLLQSQLQRNEQSNLGQKGSVIDSGTLVALQQLYQLLCLCFIEQAAGNAIIGGLLRHDELAQLRLNVAKLCAVLTSDSVNLVEAWQISDVRLDSTLGRRDGKYMEALYEAAKAEPLNTEAAMNGGVSVGYSRYLKELLRDGPAGSSLPVAFAKL